MSDILCRICGEPWDNFGITTNDEGDMTREEVKKFRAGKGCPSCDFGSRCTHCSGTGLEPAESILLAACETCWGQRQVFARQLWVIDGWGPLQYGYEPLVKTAPEGVRVISYGSRQPCLEGEYRSVRVACWDCKDEQQPCSVCKGDAKFHKRELTAQEYSERLNSLLDNSDEEPIGLIEGWL